MNILFLTPKGQVEVNPRDINPCITHLWLLRT